MIPNGTWTSEVRGSDLVTALAGELDVANCDEIFERLKVEIADVPTRRVVLDLSGVTFLDSSGIRMLLRAKGAAEDVGSTLVVRAPRPQALRVLEVSGLDGHLTLEP